MNNSDNSLLNRSAWLDSSQSIVMEVQVKPYTMKELCQLYNLSYWTMRVSLQKISKKIGEKRGYFYTVKQVEIIFSELGIPYNIVER